MAQRPLQHLMRFSVFGASTLALWGCHVVRDGSPVHPLSRPAAAQAQRIMPPDPIITMIPTVEPSPPQRSTPPAAAAENAPVDQTADKVDVPEAAVLEPLEDPPATLNPVPTPELNPLCLALKAYLEDHPEEALAILSTYHPRDQELLLRLLPVIAKVENGGLLTDRMAGEEKLNLLEVVQSLSRDLQLAAPLVIDKLVFCDAVSGFGRAVLRPSNHFRAGDRVTVYVELQNLIDQRATDQVYLTRLASRLAICQGDKVVRRVPVQSLPDESWSPRQDHFSSITFHVPKDLEPGVYTLRVSITDLDTQRTADRQIAFHVASFAASKLP